MITEPTMAFDFPGADYFADPTPTPSLTQSIAKILLERAPAHARLAHPRLNPDWQPDEPTKYDIGNIAHTLLLGPGKDLVVIEGDDWVKDKKAKGKARAAAQADGKLGVLSRDLAIGAAMAAAAREQLAERGYGQDWDEGHAEVMIAWAEGDRWFRALIDWMPVRNVGRRVWDYKTTKRSVAPHGIDPYAVDQGWDIQAAMHERGLNVLSPGDAGRRQHFFLAQESDPPFAATVVETTEAFMTMGRKKLDFAVGIWNRCMATDEWPRYPLETHRTSYPGWAEQRWLARELEGSARPEDAGDDNILMAG